MPFQSTKRFSGYSACFRQWRAESHCRFLHGYDLEFKATFEGPLDDRNWVVDFGCFKRNGVKDLLAEWFDHTLIVAEDDPMVDDLEDLAWADVAQVRVMEDVGCEKFAEHVFKIIDKETDGYLVSIECFENNNNSAIYYRSDND